MTADETFEAHGFAWRSVPGAAAALRKDERFARPGGDASVVKEGPARRVWRFDNEGVGGVFVKECHVPDTKDRLKYLVRRPKALSERLTLTRLAQLGVAVPDVLAVGVRRNGPLLDSSILVTRSLGDVVPLDRFVLEGLCGAGHARVAAFTERFAAFVRGLHDAGVRPRDFHAANVMVGGAGERFHLVDVADVRVSDALPHHERLANLAVLGHFFCRVVPRHWRLRFLKAYLDEGVDHASAARSVERRAERGMRRIWAGRDRRILGQNKYFRHVRVGHLIGHRRRTREALAAVRLFEGGDPLAHGAATLKSSRSSQVSVVGAAVDGDCRKVLIKKRRPRRGRKALLDPFRMSRAKRGFFFGAAFENRHLPTPRVLAALDERRRCCLRSSYLATEYVEGAENLAAVLALKGRSPLYAGLVEQKRPLLERLARTLRRMHWCGFSMRDLKAANVLLYERDGVIDFMLIDLDGVRFYPRGVPERRAMGNLARLYFDVSVLGGMSRREALDFLRLYMSGAKHRKLAECLGIIYNAVRRKRASFRPKGVFVEATAGNVGKES
ncbi:MAG: lipopolysaccharide kinase InaA family protein [Planctomycetota bacterium]|jgi:tRNA A-37 threonylcarbamoyl transferase component Bud32